MANDPENFSKIEITSSLDKEYETLIFKQTNNTMSEIMDFKAAQVQKSLVKLGWAPSAQKKELLNSLKNLIAIFDSQQEPYKNLNRKQTQQIHMARMVMNDAE